MMPTSKRLAREIARVLHTLGESTADGRLLLDPEVVYAAVEQLELDAAPARAADDAAEGDEAEA